MKRKQVGNQCLYHDPATHDVAYEWSDGWNFSLPALDDWIEQRCAPERRAQMIEHRQDAIDAHLAGNYAAVMPWLMYFTTAIDLDIARMALMPRAIARVESNAKQRDRRRDKPGSKDHTDEHGEDRNDKIRRYHARLVEQGRTDATDATAVFFGLSRRQVQRILNPK